VVVGRWAVHLCLTLIIKELKISGEHDKVVTTLNFIFYCSVLTMRSAYLLNKINHIRFVMEHIWEDPYM
jgi:hypothetical protein